MKKAASSTVKEKFELMIREAEIIMRGSNPEQRERGREKLRDVIRLAEGSVYAQRASEILAATEPQLPEPLDPELDELMQIWPSIQGFNDYRLADFLRRLESYQGMAVPLRTVVIRELRKWIIDELPQVGVGLSSIKAAALNAFVAAVHGVPAFEELPEFSQLRDRLFQKRLQETAARVDTALAVWSLDEGQRLLSELAPFPNAFADSVKHLQGQVDEADDLRRTVDRLLRQCPDRAPGNWFEARLQTELQEQLEQYQTNNRVPQDWRLRLAETLSALTEFINQFVRGRAQAAVTVPMLRDFWTEFKQLRGENAERLSGDWFRDTEESLTASARRNVERAANNDELMTVANRLRTDAEGIPPTLAVRMSVMADAVSHMGTTWKAMQEGQSFVLPASEPGGLPLPTALQAESQSYSGWAEQIDAALNSFVSETPLQSEKDYYDLLDLAETILAKVPNHALASKLQQETKRRLNCYRLDQALTNWNLELFFELFEGNSPGEIYGALAAERGVLVELRDLTHQPPLKNWREAREWWDRWQAAAKRLPLAKPDALVTVLDQHVSRRRLERYATLERLLQDVLTPQEYEIAASSLDHETDASLKSYQQELLRKAVIGRIEGHIRNGRLENAAKELRNLPSTSKDGMRLRTHLEFEQARGQGNVAAAEYLFREWENVRAYVEQPEHLLLETITAVWTEDHRDSVRKMLRLISRLLREVTENELTRKLNEWQTWLEIEEELLNNFSSGGVKQLAEYLRNAEPGELLDQRLKRILSHWQSEGNTVMLAWGYQAFKSVSTAAHQFDEAADKLVKESDQVANEVESVLAASTTLDLDDINSFLASLQKEEKRWKSLDDFLSLVPHPVEHREPSQKFSETKRRVNEMFRILTSLERLKDADLRLDTSRQDYEDAYSRTRRLRGIASRPRILEHLERMRPLLEELFSLQKRIAETAEQCRSKEALNVLQPKLFDKLANYVQNVVEVFVKADAHGGAMWTLVSVEYEANIYREACVLLPVSGFCELDQLVKVFAELHAEEMNFIEALSLLEDRDRQPKVAWGGAFDPIPHLDYLRLIPQQAPRSLKVYHRFERACRDTLKIILEAPESRPHLPVWVHNYLDNGVPLCTSGH
jgi:hypothetical protein